MKKDKRTKYIALSGIYTTKKPRNGYWHDVRQREKFLQGAYDRTHRLCFSNNRRRYHGKPIERWRALFKQEAKGRRAHETNSIF